MVGAEHDDLCISNATAEEPMRSLESGPVARWVSSKDINGLRICLRTRMIQYVREYALDQRAAEREFNRAARREEKADRHPWEDDR